MAKSTSTRKSTTAKSTKKKVEKPELSFEQNNDNSINNVEETDKKKIAKESTTNDSKKTDTIFSFDIPIYLQIHAGNIYNIFGSGLIAPTRYIRNRSFLDPQSLADSFLVVSNQIISQDVDSIVLLELNITASEKVEFTIEGNIAFLEKPLPISRIKCIFVNNEKVKKDIISTALLNDGGIIPEGLIVSSLPSNLNVISAIQPIKSNHNTDYSIDIKRYNSILGSLAFLKNYSILLANKTDTIASFPEHFFFALQALNKLSSFQSNENNKVVSFYRQLFMLQNGIESFSLKWIFDRINDNRNFTNEDVKDFGTILLKNSKSKEFLASAKDILQALTNNLDRKSAIKVIPSLNDSEKFYLYLFALLRTYGNVNSEDKSISRADMPEFISHSYGEFVFALLGYFYGYSILRNYEDKVLLNDKYFIDYFNLSKRISIKFEMTTLFDYVVIESVYSTSFNKTSEKIDTNFLQSNSIKAESFKSTSALPTNYTLNSENIFGKCFYQIYKKSVFDDITEIVNKLPIDIPVVSTLGVYCYTHGLPKHFLNLNELLFSENKLKYFIFYKREEIIDAIKNGKLNTQELLQRIQLSTSSRELP